MSDTEEPKIVFPCPDYPIKVMGDAGDAFRPFVEEVMARHDPQFDPSKVRVRPSRNGRFISVNVVIMATGPDQLSVIFAELKQNPAVRMVL